MKNIGKKGNQLEVIIRGFIVGEIWMPCTYASMPFALNITRERERFTDGSLTIVEAVERVLNNGNFRWTALAEIELVISFTTWDGNKRITTSRTIDIIDSPLLAEHKADEETMNEYHAIDYDGVIS